MRANVIKLKMLSPGMLEYLNNLRHSHVIIDKLCTKVDTLNAFSWLMLLLNPDF